MGVEKGLREYIYLFFYNTGQKFGWEEFTGDGKGNRV